MLVHCQHITQAAVERSFLIDRSAARGFEHKVDDLDAERGDVAIQRHGTCLLYLR